MATWRGDGSRQVEMPNDTLWVNSSMCPSDPDRTYNQTCLLRPPKGLPVGGLNREICDFDQHVVKYNKSQETSSMLINTLCTQV